MPVKWTPELDSILLHAVFEESAISFSKALCNKISERVKGTGIECSPKAVENRLYAWKKKNISSTPSSNAAPFPGKDASATPTPAKGSPAKVKTGRTRGGGKKAAASKQITPESDEPESPSLRGKKRARDEEDEEEMAEKKVKVEDSGEGEDEDEEI